MLGYFASVSFPYLHCDKSWLLAVKYLTGFTVLRAHLTAGLGHPGFVSLAVWDKWFKGKVTNGQSQHTAGFISREGLGWSPKDFRPRHPLSQRIPAASNFFPGATRARVTCRSPLSVRLRVCSASGRVSVLFGHRLRATCGARSSTWCARELLERRPARSRALPVLADVQQRRGCSPDEARCRRARAAGGTVRGSWKGTRLFSSRKKQDGREPSCILLVQQLQSEGRDEKRPALGCPLGKLGERRTVKETPTCWWPGNSTGTVLCVVV